jgi:hypothetical protein
MQSIENQLYRNLLGQIPKNMTPNTKVISSEIGMKPKRLARLLNGTAKNVKISEVETLADYFAFDFSIIIQKKTV